MFPKVLYQMPQCAGKTFMPSNGTEGMIFNEAFCDHCIHEKFTHTQKHGDLQCDIYNRSFLHWYEPTHPDYPKEWVFDTDGWSICTAWVKWDWGRNDDGLNEPSVVEPDDPMQLCLPFELTEMEFNPKPEYQIHE